MDPNRRVLRPRPPPPPPKQPQNTESTKNDSDLIPSLPAIQQNSCFLFTIFPPEIRNRIYTFSLESENIDIPATQSPTTTNNENDNTTTTNNENHNQHNTIQPTIHPHLYRQNAFYYRPGYKQPKRIQTALLQTCQQIYNEASLLPASINEHTFWFYRSPPHVKDASSPLGYFRKMSPKQRAQVHHLHFFTQQFFLEDKCWSRIWEGMQIGTLDLDSDIYPDGGKRQRYGRRQNNRAPKCVIAPKKMTITFRHTDWWFWENNEPLGIDPFRPGRTRANEMGRRIDPSHAHPNFELKQAWGNQFTTIPSLEELVIEFETIMRKRDQLDAIIQRALSWKFPVQPELEKPLYLVAEPASRRAYTWIGAREGDLKRQPLVGRADLEPRRALVSCVVPGQSVIPAVPVLRTFDPEASAGGAGSGGQAGGEINAEEFYVVFLTWKRQVVEE